MNGKFCFFITKSIKRLIKRIVVVLAIISIHIGIVCVASPFEYGTLSNDYRYVMHNHNESSYQHAWCSAHNGIDEYQNKDFTRVDCLTQQHAVEFDFANKWAECIGQAEHYAYMTGERGMCVLILDGMDWEKQLVYYNRVKKLGKIHNFDVEYMTDDILKLNDKGQCPYADCKCHKKKKGVKNVL